LRSKTIPGFSDVNSIRNSNRVRCTRTRFSEISLRPPWLIKIEGEKGRRVEGENVAPALKG
jgi:hypothetical protein